MKRIIVSLLAGVALGTTGVGLAASQNYWQQSGRTYRCQGSADSVFCKETNWRTGYEVGIFPSRVVVSFGSHVVMGCLRKQQPAHNCQSFVASP
jgi:hypothetical protein